MEIIIANRQFWFHHLKTVLPMASMFGYIFILLTVGVWYGRSNPIPLTMLENPQAKCLDGSLGGYYYEPSSDPDASSKWVIYLNGGGECDNADSCEWATTGSLGSSKYFANTSDSSGWYFGSDYCPYNPDFCTWNHVNQPYCSQDLHSGQRTEANDETYGLYFSGHLILEAMLDDLDLKGLKDATEIILHGVSAGGIGVWMNLDWLQARYTSARVTGLGIASHYFYATYYNGVNSTDPGGMADFRENAFPDTYELYNAYVNEDCKSSYISQGLSPAPCMISNQSMEYIKSDAFVIQSQTDQVVLTGHDCWPEDYMYDEPEMTFMVEWHNNMTVALEPLMEKRNSKRGVFAAACYTHGGFSHSGPLINGKSMYDAFGSFYFKDRRGAGVTPPSSYKLSDDCGVMCGTNCPSF